MLRQAENAGYFIFGAFRKRVYFMPTRGEQVRLSCKPAQWDQLLIEQRDHPIFVCRIGHRVYWMFHDIWENDALQAHEVQALILDRERKRERTIERAVQRMTTAEESRFVREPIPDDVKIFVWQRDRGQCVRCGTNANLEFDHIIPVSMGGSTTARNVQLLCSSCNLERARS